MNPPNPANSSTFVFFNEIGIIGHLANTAFERVLPDGLSLAGFTVLNHLIRLGHERRPPGLIASALQVTRGAITGTVKRLESQGWVRTERDPKDGRGKGVSITEAGRKIREDAIEALSPVLGQILTAIDETELLRTLPTLQKVRAYLDADRDS